MKHKILTGLSFVIACLVVVPSLFAQAAPKSAILYKITGKILKKPSYLFGTQHILCEKDCPSYENLGLYFHQTRQVMLEVDMNNLELRQKVAKESKLSDGKSLKDYLTAEEFLQLDNIFKSYLGVSFDLVKNMKPMYASCS